MGAKKKKTIAVHDSEGNLKGSLATGGKSVPTVDPVAQQLNALLSGSPFVVGDQAKHREAPFMVTVTAVTKCDEKDCKEFNITFLDPISKESDTAHASEFELYQEYKNPLARDGIAFSKRIRVETPRCHICGETGSIQVREAGLLDYQGGKLAQEAFPDLPMDIREQFISGTHPACWTATFGSPDDDEEDDD